MNNTGAATAAMYPAKKIKMIKPLRKRHLQIWSMLMVLLPVSIVSAWRAIPKPATDKLLQPAAAMAYPLILKTVEKENYTIRLRKDNNSLLQLEWLNKKTLTAPTATIYKIATGSNDIKSGSLIGRIEASGTYRFPVDSSFLPFNSSGNKLLLYDFIHQQIIDSVKF
jgi:hypothetical protein